MHEVGTCDMMMMELHDYNPRIYSQDNFVLQKLLSNILLLKV